MTNSVHPIEQSSPQTWSQTQACVWQIPARLTSGLTLQSPPAAGRTLPHSQPSLHTLLGGTNIYYTFQDAWPFSTKKLLMVKDDVFKTTGACKDIAELSLAGKRWGGQEATYCEC